MGDGLGEAPVAQEFKYLGSILSKKFDDIRHGVTIMIMARIMIRLARIAFKFTELQNLNLNQGLRLAIFGTTRRRVALESKKMLA
jgi:hypothetical protein